MMMESSRRAPLPPRWFVRSAWAIHRAAYAVTGGRRGLRTPTADRYGMLRLRTVGRRTGKERIAILGYIEDGSNLVTKAMNGWADPQPDWWLNLLAHPDARVDLVDGSRPVLGRSANEDEWLRLWARWAVYNEKLDAHAALRSRQTQVVILEPRSDAQPRGNRSVRSVVYAVPTQQIDQGSVPAAGQPGEKTETMTHNRIPGALRPLLALLVIGLVAVGCTSANAKAAEMGASCDQFGTQKSITQTTEMAVGDQVKVTLCSNPTTGFAWQAPEISDTAIVSLADKSFGAPTSASAPVVGAAGTDYITLKATAKGTSTVVLRYSQPWVGGTSSEWTYTLTVTVR